ncbi:MAG: 23S rRNA (pseudouridine(1915)-N(3))-methyltransferase RlmH [Pseudomonadota bacterium]
MHIRLVAVGDRQPAWVDEAVAHYTKQFPPQWKFHIDSIATVKRAKNDKGDRARIAECDAILSRIESGDFMVLLDERGKQFTSMGLADKLSQWQSAGRDLAFIIGGPDGVDERCRARADACWALSELTLPHGMARMLLSEQLYRAMTIQSGHPYHRQ